MSRSEGVDSNHLHRSLYRSRPILLAAQTSRLPISSNKSRRLPTNASVPLRMCLPAVMASWLLATLATYLPIVAKLSLAQANPRGFSSLYHCGITALRPNFKFYITTAGQQYKNMLSEGTKKFFLGISEGSSDPHVFGVVAVSGIRADQVTDK